MRKIGEGHAGAMLRLGLRELRAAAYPDSNVAQTPEYGEFGTLTPGEVAESRRGDGRGPEQEGVQHSIVGDRLRQASDRDDTNRDSKDLERG